jgi:hypothetical protein
MDMDYNIIYIYYYSLNILIVYVDMWHFNPKKPSLLAAVEAPSLVEPPGKPRWDNPCLDLQENPRDAMEVSGIWKIIWVYLGKYGESLH